MASSSTAPSYDRFFVAWTERYSPSPFQVQMFEVDTRQERQYANWWADEKVLSFARANPGRLYIVGDEPDQWCTAPEEYASIYHGFVETMRGVDPTARFSPAGFAEPNARCCPEGDEQCKVNSHSIGYAEQFYNAYVRRFGKAPRVDEWRFHDFGLFFSVGDVAGWWGRVDRAAAWSVAHGANMYLGAWGFLGWAGPDVVYQEYMKQGIGRLLNDKRINGAAYWAYQSWAGETHYLANADGSLTAAGRTHANPLTDIPTGLKLVGTADGRARLRWTNTTSAWGAEVEFWVRPVGSSSFVYQKTERVPSLGANQSPVVSLNAGEAVRARVRYYNVYGQAEWSSFSNTVLPVTDAGTDQKVGRGKSPIFCVLQVCQ